MTDRIGQRQKITPGYVAHIVHRRRRLLSNSTWMEETTIVDVSMSGMLVQRTASEPSLEVGTTIRVVVDGLDNTMKVARVDHRQGVDYAGLNFVQLHHDTEGLLLGLAAGERASKDWYWELNR